MEQNLADGAIAITSEAAAGGSRARCEKDTEPEAAGLLLQHPCAIKSA